MVIIKKTIDFPITEYVNHYILDVNNVKLQIDAGAVPLKEEAPVPDYVLITHWHWDHIYGIIGKKDLNICINKESYDLLKPDKVVEHMKIIVESVEGKEAWESIKDQAELFSLRYKNVYESLNRDHNIFWMDECPPIVKGLVKVFECPGHSSDHVCFLIDDKIFVGDNMAPSWNVTLIDPLEYLKTLYKIMGENSWKTLYPGHGDPLSRPEATSHIITTITSKIRRMCKTLSLIGDSISLDKLITKVYEGGIDGMMKYVAARSLNGYIANLEKLGVIYVDRSVKPWRTGRLTGSTSDFVEF